MMRSRRLHAQKKALFWLGSSWRKKILPKPVNDAIWKRANDVLSCEEHERQISSDTSPFEQNTKVPQVKHHFLLWKQVITTRHLGQTGKARGHHGAIMPAVDTLLELGTERRAFRTRFDK